MEVYVGFVLGSLYWSKMHLGIRLWWESGWKGVSEVGWEGGWDGAWN